MLYNPKWNQPSVAGFKAWLEMQPRDGEFNYFACEGCAVGQYFASLGLLPENECDIYISLNTFPKRLFWDRARRRPITFGDVLDEINKADV